MPSINTLIKMIQNGTTAEVSYSLIPEEERRNTASMEMLISFLEESSEFDTLDVNGYELTPDHRKRLAVLILTKPNLRHLTLSEWEIDTAFLESIIQKPLQSLHLCQCGPLAFMSSISAGTSTLENLSIKFSSFSERDIASIKQIKTLKQFECNSPFSVKGLMELIHLKQFEALILAAKDVTENDISDIQEAIKANNHLIYLNLHYKNPIDNQYTSFIHEKAAIVKPSKIKVYSIMDSSSDALNDVKDAFSSIQSGARLRIVLLDLGYNPNTYDDNYYKRNELNPVLNCHIANEQHEKAIKIIETFPELDPMMTDWEGKNALHIACKAYTADKVIFALIKHHFNKLDLDAQDNRGCTPLHYLCAYGKLELVKKFTQLGCKLDIKDKFGRTPEDYAKSSKIEVEQLLNSIAVCPFRDTNAPFSGHGFKLPPSFPHEHIPYFPAVMGNVVCLSNVQASFDYINSANFRETYADEKSQESKLLQQLMTTLSGKSVIEECMENKAALISYLSIFAHGSHSPLLILGRAVPARLLPLNLPPISADLVGHKPINFTP